MDLIDRKNLVKSKHIMLQSLEIKKNALKNSRMSGEVSRSINITSDYLDEDVPAKTMKRIIAMHSPSLMSIKENNVIAR